MKVLGKEDGWSVSSVRWSSFVFVVLNPTEVDQKQFCVVTLNICCLILSKAVTDELLAFFFFFNWMNKQSGRLQKGDTAET